MRQPGASFTVMAILLSTLVASRAEAQKSSEESMAAYADAHVAAGGRLNNVTRHMLGLFHGEPGGRLFRRYIAENAPSNCAPGDVAAGDVLRQAGRVVRDTATAMRERRSNVPATAE